MCDLLKSKVECRDFLEKLEDARASVPLNTFGISSELNQTLLRNCKQIVVRACEDRNLEFTGPSHSFEMKILFYLWHDWWLIIIHFILFLLLFFVMVEECSSWDVVSDVDLWESGDALDQEGYIVVKQEDIVDGIACFMAAYLLSLKETKVCSHGSLSLSHIHMCVYIRVYG